MAIVASASSSSFVLNNEVFISFRGDTRKNFTSHLYAALCRKRIQAYIDEEDLERGDEISPALSRAIDESLISIVVFSKEYASSRWCLDELVHILKCKKERGQMLVPIFYGVDPSDIRKQRGSYGDAFAAHEKRFVHDKNKVKAWRDALTEAANLSGFHLQYEHESKLIEKIVEDVFRKLNRFRRISFAANTNGLLGIDERLKEIESLLCFESPYPRVIGLLGIGGIGKTTLARAFFDKFSYQFESCCFLENVRENSEKYGLSHLENELFSKLLEERDLETVTPFMKNRVRNKMVLIIFDDIDNIMRLERLFGDGSWFGPRSKIIITTRDAKVLKRYADKVYEVKALDSEKALELFYLNAFRTKPSTARYIELSKEIVNHTGGNPLALKVLGSSFHSQTLEYWESAWSKLKIIPNPKIQKVLRISYDGLDDKQQDILLDIACFFKGERRDFVESILDDCDLFVRSGIEDLINKSLITITDGGSIWMHDLIQEMGWEVVREQSLKDLTKRSRLWIPQDVYHVLDNNRATKKIEGIYFDISKMDDDLHLDPAVFTEMYNMRLLKIYTSNVKTPNKFKIYLTQGLQFLPHSLRYLYWHSYPLKSLPSNYKAKNLVELDMPCSNLKQLWSGVQNLANLKRINLGYSKELVKLPDLSLAPKLESINLEGCTNLVEIPPLNFLTAFGTLTLRGCIKIKSLPKISGNIKFLDLAGTRVKQSPSSLAYFDSLMLLDLNACQHIKELPALPRNIEKLDVGGTSIKHVSTSSIEGLSRLKEFSLWNCQKLESLPTNLFKLKSLYRLNLAACPRLKEFTEASSNLKGTRIQKLPNSSMYEKLFGLRREDIGLRKKLEFVPNWVYNLSILKFLSLRNRLLRPADLRLRLSSLFSLERLQLDDCNVVEIPDWLGLLSSLRELYLGGNPFEKIPSSIRQLNRLIMLDIRNCKKLRSLPQLPMSLTELDASGCSSLETISSSGFEFIQRHMSETFLAKTHKRYQFLGCWKLDQKSKSYLSDPIYRSEESMQGSFSSSIRVCYPGNEIPTWSSHLAEGDSISMKLPKYWNNSDFVGFAICFVAASLPSRFKSSKADWLFINFDVHLKDKSGQIHNDRVDTYWVINHDDMIIDKEVEEAKITSSGITSEHVFVSCYKAHASRFYHDAIEASFHVRCNIWMMGDFEDDPIYNSLVKRIGVRLLYGKEEKEQF